MRRSIFSIISFFLLAFPASVSASQFAATPSPDASPSPAVDLGQYLLTEDQVPESLDLIQDGARTLQDVSAGFEDPEATMEQFLEWGWNGNVVRAFHLPEGADADPAEIDGIYMSVHAFGSPDAAAAALDYSADAHASGGGLDELDDIDLGDASRALYGEMSYGDEITIYVQQDNVLIRLSAASPEGDPTEEAIRLTRLVLDAPTATPVATPS